jgi:hypothetical protein
MSRGNRLRTIDPDNPDRRKKLPRRPVRALYRDRP